MMFDCGGIGWLEDVVVDVVDIRLRFPYLLLWCPVVHTGHCLHLLSYLLPTVEIGTYAVNPEKLPDI